MANLSLPIFFTTSLERACIMKRFFISLSAVLAIGLTPLFAFAQTGTGLVHKGYTDPNGALLPKGDSIKMSVKSEGGTTTVTINGLHAYGEANLNPKDSAAKQEAIYQANPAYFDGGTVYALRHGNYWRGGRTATSVDLQADKSAAVLAKGPVAKGDGTGQVTLTFPSLKAAKDFECQSTTFMILKKDNKRAWIGHSGYATSNLAGNIGDHLFLVRGHDERDDARFPGTGFCYDKTGALVPLTTMYQGKSLRLHLAKLVQKPAGVEQDAQKDD